jgi:heme exporter protein A
LTVLLRFNDVTLRRGGRLLFDGLSFDLRPGDALQVRGRNGSGKSSLIRLAAGLLEQEHGKVERSTLALADDHVALDRERSLRTALSLWGGNIDQALETYRLSHLAAVPVRLLSSGQLKRATLARVHASAAPLWLLDEPLNALDADGIAELDSAITMHLASGGAVLAASHQPLPGEWRTIDLEHQP